MTRIAFLASMFAVVGFAAFADTFNASGVVLAVQPQYNTVTQAVPIQNCYNTQVPVYGGTQGSVGDTVTGAIIGGAIGNQMGNGKGKDAMTMLGAIVGADIANRNKQGVVGYRNERVCETIYRDESVTTLTGYIVDYKFNSTRHSDFTTKRYNVGDAIPIRVTVSVR